MKTILLTAALCMFSTFAAPGDLRWSFNAGYAIRSSPAIGTNGWIIFATLRGDVYALDPIGGTVQWKKSLGGRMLSSPSVAADGRVFIGGTNGVVALNGTTGNQEWQFKTNISYDFYSTEIMSTPTLYPGGKIIYQTASAILTSILTGSPKAEWQLFISSSQTGPPNISYSSPVIDRNGTIFVGSTGSSIGNLSAIDVQSGKVLWKLVSENWFNSTPAIGEDGTIFASGHDRIVYALDPTSGAKKWTNVLGDSMTSSPVLDTDGTLYVGANDGRLYALDSKTGQQKWRFLARDTIHSTPAIAADGTVYFGSYDKNVYALDGRTGTNKWTFNAGGFVLSSPLIGPDATVYIGSYNNMLYALEGSAPLANSAWPMFKGNPRHTGAAEDSPLVRLNNPRLSATGLEMELQAPPSGTRHVEFTESLSSARWTDVTNPTGSSKIVGETNTTSGFFRIRMQ